MQSIRRSTRSPARIPRLRHFKTKQNAMTVDLIFLSWSLPTSDKFHSVRIVTKRTNDISVKLTSRYAFNNYIIPNIIPILIIVPFQLIKWVRKIHFYSTKPQTLNNFNTPIRIFLARIFIFSATSLFIQYHWSLGFYR